MQCASCNSNIPESFIFAIQKNECPACGQSIMDEEMLALIDGLRNCVSSTITLRAEAVDKIVWAIIGSYEIAPGSGMPQSVSMPSAAVAKTARPVQQFPSVKPKPMTRAQIAAAEEGISPSDLDEGIIKVSAVVSDSNYTDEERERIMVEAVTAKMNMIPSSSAATTPEALRSRVGIQGEFTDRQLSESPILEAERLRRLQKQEANMASGMASVRRREE